jgi:hypothetical protein
MPRSPDVIAQFTKGNSEQQQQQQTKQNKKERNEERGRVLESIF